MLPLARLLKVPSGVRPNPNAVSRPLTLGLVDIVFATLVTVITNDVGEKLLTVNVALARSVAPGFAPDQVTVKVVFPLTGTLACAALGATEARISANTETVIHRVFTNIPMVRVLPTSR